MATRRIPRIALLGCLLLTAPAARAQDAPAAHAVSWRFDYAKARKEAQEKDLPLVIDFGTKNCFWCKKLDDSTFRDPAVIGAMNERFIPLKIDAERDVQLTTTLRISSYPTIVLAAPDGRILGTVEGFQEAPVFQENLNRVLATLAPPEWMQRDLASATKWFSAGDYARAIPALKTILEDGKSRPIQAKAEKLLKEIEQKAAERLARAQQFKEKGQVSEALETITETLRVFPGAPASKDAAELLAKLVQDPDLRTQHRSKRAKDLLAQAQEYYRNKEYIPCLDRCEVLLAHYGDMTEGTEATALLAEIKNNPEWLQTAADTMSDRLGGIYLALADSLLKRGQVARAEFYLQRVIQSFPGSRQAESAQIRIAQLNGVTPRRNEIQSARP
jgi:tetratricopeptide (TPR) repeat protein